MIKKLSISMALLASAFSVQAQNQHDFVGYGSTKILSTSKIISKSSITPTLYVEKSIQSGMFVGFNLLAFTLTEVTFGKEIPFQDNMHIEATATYGTNSEYIPLVLNGGAGRTPERGLSAGAIIVMSLAKNQINFGVSKGISGDYSDSNMLLSTAIRINPKPNMFTDLGYNVNDIFIDISYRFNSDKSVFAGIIGMYF
jgi:hypothetical protein